MFEVLGFIKKKKKKQPDFHLKSESIFLAPKLMKAT